MNADQFIRQFERGFPWDRIVGEQRLQRFANFLNGDNGGSTPSRWDSARLTHSQRPRLNLLADTKNALPTYAWRAQLALSQNLFANLGEVEGLILEKATLATVPPWTPRYFGANERYKEEAEDWLAGWHKRCDLRGYNFSANWGLYLASIALDRDGDIGLLRTRDEQGEARIQYIPAHRIGVRGNEKVVKSGPHEGLAIVNGVIFSAAGAPIAYRVLGSAPQRAFMDSQEDEDRDVSSANMMLLFEPKWPDQPRGIPSGASVIRKCFDYEDIHTLELIGIKGASVISLVETNQSGQADDAGTRIMQGVEVDGKKVTLEMLDEGAIRYLKGMTGSKIETMRVDRPGGDTREFLETIHRGFCAAYEMPYSFIRKPDAGGANVRKDIGRVVRTVRKRQETLRRAALFRDRYGLADAITRGEIRSARDWWAFDYQLPSSPTVDVGREGNLNLKEMEFGSRTLEEDAGEQGFYWEDIQDQGAKEKARGQSGLYQVAQKLAERFPDLTAREWFDRISPPPATAPTPVVVDTSVSSNREE